MFNRKERSCFKMLTPALPKYGSSEEREEFVRSEKIVHVIQRFASSDYLAYGYLSNLIRQIFLAKKFLADRL